MKIIIMRGLPGAGKSRWIKGNLLESATEVFSADNYHMIEGVYRYDPKQAGFAHDKCFRAFVQKCLQVRGDAVDTVVVDNTNTTLVELAPYVRMAQSFGIDYTILYITCDPLTAIERNVHGVPANTILAMHKNLLTEIVPAYWKQEVE